VADSFVHLHVHTEYSMLDGAAKIKPALKAAAADGQRAFSITDHGNQFGAYEVWSEAGQMREDGTPMTAIIGMEAYMAPGSRFHKKPVYWGGGNKPGQDANGESGDVSGSGKYTHMTLIAQNAQGLRALFEFGARASKEGKYGKHGRGDAELLAEVIANWPGATIIGTTGCPGGEVQTRIRLGQMDKALEAAAKYRDILGKENFFLELMDHGIPVEKLTRDSLLQLANKLDIPLLATNDLHYVAPEDAPVHDALLCVQTGAEVAQAKRFRFEGDQYYLKSAQEMRQLFAELPAACDNTLAIADRIAPDAYDEVFLPRTDLLPAFPVPEGHTEESLLREKIVAGLQKRYPDPAGPEKIRADAHERTLGYEFPVLAKAGYPGYMLTVADFVNEFKRRGVRVGPGRGSAAGSAVSYALGITDVPTLENGLLFERFLNPERVSPPDVDVDFPEKYQKDVFKYLEQRWGIDNTCRIQTLGRIKAKAAITDAARVLGLPVGLAKQMTGQFPKAISGFDAPLSCVTDEKNARYEEAEDFRQLLAKEPGAQQIYNLACKIEGQLRATGIHACGEVVSGKSLIGLIPLTWNEKEQCWVSGFPNAEVLEPMGFLKVDILALKNLDIIERSVVDIKVRHGVDVDPLLSRLDDPKAYAELRSGRTTGLFQVESGGMAKLLALMRADRFGDISAGLALYRPGPMSADAHTDYALRKTGRQQVKPIHPELEERLRPVLADTYGVFAYQEEIMRAAQEVAGYTLGQADILRKIMGKKKPEQLEKARPPFFAGMREQGFSEEAAQALWDVFEPFSAYAFNISHTVSYGFITYATAFLKAHYPAEYMASLLTQSGDDADEKAMYLAECRRMGLTVLVPDVNESGPDFTVIGTNQIRFGLNAVSGLGAKAVPGIISGRQDGPYRSFNDFLARVPLATCSKGAVAALIRGGAFDSLGHTRRSLLDIPDADRPEVLQLETDGKTVKKSKRLSVYAAGVGAQADVKKNEEHGQFDLFSTTPEVQLNAVQIPDLPEFDKDYKLQLEREALGLYVSGHPLDELEPVLAGNRTMTIGELAIAIAVDDEGMVNDPTVKGAVLAGQIVSAEHWIARSGKPCAKLVLADLDSQIEIMAFSRAVESFKDMLQADKKLRMKVRLWERDEGEAATVCVEDVAELDHGLVGAVTGEQPVQLFAPAERFDADLLQQVRIILQRHPGPRELKFVVGERSWMPADWTVTPDVEFVTEMKELLGRDSVKV
jgi:DNA polymerase III subunit alpha